MTTVENPILSEPIDNSQVLETQTQNNLKSNESLNLKPSKNLESIESIEKVKSIDNSENQQITQNNQTETHAEQEASQFPISPSVTITPSINSTKPPTTSSTFGSSLNSAPTSASTQKPLAPLPAIVLVKKSLESIAASKESQRVIALESSTKRALQLIKDYLTSPATVSQPPPNVIFEPFRLACKQFDNNDLKLIALDALSKLLAFGYFYDPSDDKILSSQQNKQQSNVSNNDPAEITANKYLANQPSNDNINESDNRDSSDVPINDVSENSIQIGLPPQIPLVEKVVNTVVDCYKGENTDSNVELQILKALSAAILNNSTVVHGAAMINATKVVFSIFCLSLSQQSQSIAETSLIQMIQAIFDRVCFLLPKSKSSSLRKSRSISHSRQFSTLSIASTLVKSSLDHGDTSPIASTLNISENSDISNSDLSSNLTVNGSLSIPQTPIGNPENLTLEALGRRSLDEPSISLSSVDLNSDASETLIKDAILVFRAMSKLASKPLSNESLNDLRSQEIRSKLLTLNIVRSILAQYHEIFTSRALFVTKLKHTGTTSNSSKVSLLDSTDTYIVSCLAKNISNPVPQIFEICAEMFFVIISKMRVKFKLEISVFLNEIYLPILEVPNFTPHQKRYTLRTIKKIAADPKILVEIYLNYDCDRTQRNLYERLIDDLSKLSSYTLQLTPEKEQQYNEGYKMLKTTNDMPSLPESLSTTYLGKFYYNPEVPLPIDYVMKRDSLFVLIEILKSLKLWSTKNVNTGLLNDSTSSVNGYLDVDSVNDDRRSLAESSVHDSSQTDLQGETPTISFLKQNETEAKDGNDIGAELEASVQTVPTDDPEQFETLKLQKKNLSNAIKSFNTKPKRGLEKLISLGFIKSDSPEDIARFLLSSPGINKSALGDFLGEGSQRNIDIMHAFVDLMDFSNTKFVDSLRNFLQCFRLPGESQKIDRFMIKFAERYISGNPGVFANADTAYVLAYSIMMLNTDLHSPQVKKRMTKEEFSRITSGINDRSDLPQEFVSSIYDEIQNNEIVLVSEREAALASGSNSQMVPSYPFLSPQGLSTNISSIISNMSGYARSSQRDAYLQLSRDLTTKTEALFRSLPKNQRKLVFYVASHVEHAGPMFEIVWMSFLAGLTGPMQETSIVEVFLQCLEGIKYAINLSCYFGIELARISFVSVLAKFTHLQDLKEMKLENVEAVKALLEIALNDGNYLHESWKDVLSCVSQLERLQLISSGINEGTIPDLLNARIANGRRGSTDSSRSVGRYTLSFTGRSRAGSIAAANNTFNSLVANESKGHEIVMAMDRIFTQSSKLSGEAIIDFVRALTEVAWEEIESSGVSASPRTFSLQKMVDVCYYNMDRIRIEWSQLWAVMSTTFEKIGYLQNKQVVFFALDSLRQLSLRFLDIEELPHFKFQKDFLKPFEDTMAHNSDPEVRDMVLQCLHQMILAKATKIRSGWRAMFGTFTMAARDKSDEIVNLTYNIVCKVYNENFHLIIMQNGLADMLIALTELAKNSKFQKIALHSVSLISDSISHYIYGSECSQEVLVIFKRQGIFPVDCSNNFLKAKKSNGISSTSSSPKKEKIQIVNKQPLLVSTCTAKEIQAIDDFTDHFLFQILHAFYTIAMTAEDLEVRTKALNNLFDIITFYGGAFTSSFWSTLFRQIFFPFFSVLHSSSEVSRLSIQEDSSMWLSSTMIHGLGKLVNLFKDYFETLEPMLGGFLNTLIDCICQENDTLARTGTSCLATLLKDNIEKLNSDDWKKFVGAFGILFRTTIANELFAGEEIETSEGSLSSSDAHNDTANTSYGNTTDEEIVARMAASATPVGAEEIERAHRERLGDGKDYVYARSPIRVDPRRKKEFSVIIVKCVLQLLIIDTVKDLLLYSDSEVYDMIPMESLLELLGLLRNSYLFARRFNNNRELRIKLYNEGFMKQLPNLLKQEVTSASTYHAVLLHVYLDDKKKESNPSIDPKKIEDAFIGICADIVRGYIVLDEETQQRNIMTWSSVLKDVFDGFLKLPKSKFLLNVPTTYSLAMEMFNCDLKLEVRMAVRNFLMRVNRDYIEYTFPYIEKIENNNFA